MLRLKNKIRDISANRSQKIYEDFTTRYMSTAKEVYLWGPHSWSKILIWLNDGTIIMYNYRKHKAILFMRKWREG